MHLRQTTLILLVIAACMMCGVGTANAGIFTSYYRNEVPIDGLISVSDPTDQKKYLVPAHWFYEIADDTGDYYTLRFNKPASKAAPDSTISSKYFKIKKTDLTDNRLKMLFVQGIEPGVMVVPFKVRPTVPGTNFQLTGDATVGAAIGIRMATDVLTTTVEPMISLGLSQVALDDTSSGVPASTQALTLATGLQVDIWERFSLGAVVGWDKVAGKEGKAWPYQGRPWYAISLTAGILNRNPAPASTPEEKPKAAAEDAKKK
jgi:hypothetical protein